MEMVARRRHDLDYDKSLKRREKGTKKIMLILRHEKLDILHGNIQWSRKETTVCLAVVVDVGISLVSFAWRSVMTTSSVILFVVCGTGQNVFMETNSRSSDDVNSYKYRLRFSFSTHVHTFHRFWPSYICLSPCAGRTILFAFCPICVAHLRVQRLVDSVLHWKYALWAIMSSVFLENRQFLKFGLGVCCSHPGFFVLLILTCVVSSWQYEFFICSMVNISMIDISSLFNWLSVVWTVLIVFSPFSMLSPSHLPVIGSF